MQVSHLVVNGCSWTYGSELDSPEEESWPKLVANKLGIPVVNLAIPGSGNDSILRRTSEYLFQNLAFNSKPLVIIAWSQITRREGWDKTLGQYNGIHIGPDSESIDKMNHSQLSHLYEYDMIDHCRRNLLYKVHMRNLLENFKIPFLHGNYYIKDYSDYVTEKSGLLVQSKFKQMYDYVHEDEFFWKKPLSNLVSRLPVTKFGHQTKHGHVVIADHINKMLAEKFKGFDYIQIPYLDLNQFDNV